MDLPERGVGITFSSAIEPLLDRHPDLIDVVEFEPQTTWLDLGSTTAGRYQSAEGVNAHIADLPFPKLVHSIGCPVGGSADHDRDQIGLLRETIRSLASPWVSEHLSFNSTGEFSTGFFLPPRQTSAGVEVAAKSIRKLRSALGVPLAFETGVNYLAPRSDELDDGVFAAAVAAEADAGILLDLHNVYTNEVNGRQPLTEFVSQLPLDRVWEIHLAGGFGMDGYWLDAHSGEIPQELLAPAKEIVSQLPNLKAIIFEIYPAFVKASSTDMLCRQLEFLHELWALRPTPMGGGASRRSARPVLRAAPDGATPNEWEHELGALVVGVGPNTDLGNELAADPGVALLQKLALEFRASMISNNLRRTVRLLVLALGEPVVRMILSKFRDEVTPQMFAGREARAFADFLKNLNVGVPQLAEVLEFELAVLNTLLDGRSRVVSFDFDPFPMLLALSEGRLPDAPSQVGAYEIEITPDAAEAMAG